MPCLLCGPGWSCGGTKVIPAIQIAEWAGVADKTARLWPVRYAESGIDGLRGIPHPGSRECTMSEFVLGSLR
jgi:hypothetical protein